MIKRNLFNIYDYQKVAKARLPSPFYHYLEGGSDDEWSVRNNTNAFEKYCLLPNYLNDVSSIDLKTRIFGSDISMPLLLSPTGMTRLFHHQKEDAVARAAAKSDVLYTVSTMATTTIEDIGATADCAKMFQIYVHKDRELTREFVQRCKNSGYKSLCLTVDTAIGGNRERDLRSGMLLPPKLTLSSLYSFATHPHWLVNFLRNPDFRLANMTHRGEGFGKGSMALLQYANSQFDRSVTWNDVEWLAQEWGGPLAIKGLQSPEDAKIAQSIGATGVIISNHGGRQLEGTPAPIDCVAPMRDAVGDGMELVVDGGIRRGTHIIKAMALGADACSIGRPYLYGLASKGEAGVVDVIAVLRQEIERSLTLLGCRSLKELSEKHIQLPIEHRA